MLIGIGISNAYAETAPSKQTIQDSVTIQQDTLEPSTPEQRPQDTVAQEQNESELPSQGIHLLSMLCICACSESQVGPVSEESQVSSIQQTPQSSFAGAIQNSSLQSVSSSVSSLHNSLSHTEMYKYSEPYDTESDWKTVNA